MNAQPWHRTLLRQMARAGLTAEDVPDERFAALLERVSLSYDDADKQRYLHDRAFSLASQEMQDLYDRLQEASESEAAVQRDRLKAVFDTAATGLIVLEDDGRIFDLNPVAEMILGLDHDAKVAEPIASVLVTADPEDPSTVELQHAIAMGDNWRCSDVLLLTGSGTLSASLLFRSMATGGGVLAVEDITERKKAQAELIWRANHDSLTGLQNRASLVDQIHRALQRARRYGTSLAVLFIDLDRFKRVNDTLGHAAGDVLLVECARRIGSAIREVDTIARIGGDEFVVLCENLAIDPDSRQRDTRVIATRIIKAVDEPFMLDGTPAYVEASIGVTFSQGAPVGPETLLRDADIALYEAKQFGGSALAFYDDSMIDRMQYALELERQLRRALPTDELWMAYQPILRLDGGDIIGFEALARWNSPKGAIAPEEFIATAESAGLLNDLGRRLIRQSLDFLTDLPGGLRVFINMSPSQVAADGIIEWFDEALQDTGADPRRLVIEITETATLADFRIGQRLAEFQSRGISIALDDFGSGHSSLSSLRTLPLNLIKLDRSFLNSTVDDPRAESLARMLCELGHALGISIVAEGIEDDDQRRFAQDMGCQYGQGILLGAPTTPEEALQRVTQHV
jgi:diguanylate cyclase (GGDEF)-like protein/PAS domain S-box-containing protein